MTNEEIKLLNAIQKTGLDHIKKEGFIPYQITISDKQWKMYKSILKQGHRATVNFNGIKWQLNVQCCESTITLMENKNRSAMI